jgi:hypothetical protein
LNKRSSQFFVQLYLVGRPDLAKHFFPRNYVTKKCFFLSKSTPIWSPCLRLNERSS